MKPLAIDLYCGLGGWTEGLLAEGYRVVGFDIERHRYPKVTRPKSAEKLPGNNGGRGSKIWSERPIARLKDADKYLPVSSDEWMEYPAQLVIQDVLTLHGSQFKNAALIVASPPCQAYSYRAMPWKRAKALPPPDNSLFEACFRIQREASEAAGHHIPLVVENVRGAQKWVGRARWHFGSFYLWGDVPALMPMVRKRETQKKPKAGTGDQFCAVRIDQIEGRKNPGFRFDGSGRSMQSESVDRHVKVPTEGVGRRTDIGKGARFTSRDCGLEGVKQRGSGREWFAGDGKISRMTSSKSPARKAASAMIAKVPFVLSQHIARVYKPEAAA